MGATTRSAAKAGDAAGALQTENAATALFLLGCALAAYARRAELLRSFTPLSSPVDWCEENYAVSVHVAEWWNTLSSLVLILVALVAPRFFDGQIYAHEPGAYMLWALMALVGTGSVYFHGTLSVAGQVLDELPISLLAMFGCFMLVPPHKWNLRVRAVLFSPRFFLTSTVASTIACILYPVLSHVFCVSWIGTTSFCFFREFGSATAAAQRAARGMFGITLGTFGAAFSCWLIDRFLCHELQASLGFNPQLHAWWHVFVSFTFWGCVCTGIILRCHADKVPIKLRPTAWGMPEVIMGRV